MTQTTEDLISQLAAGAERVKRLRSPSRRAGLWLAGAAVGSAVLVAWFADMEMFMERARDPRHAVELAATVLTGLIAIVAAFQLSIPGSNRHWVWAPVPALAVWLATTGYGCVASWFGGVKGSIAESIECFEIIVALSVPLGITVLVMLYRARPLAPAPVAAMAGLGIAAIGAFVLQFFHPFDVTVLDLAFHGAAVGLVIAVSTASSRAVSKA